MLSLPGYFQDPLVGKTQDQLYGFGSDLLAGRPGSYFGGIGESGGPELEALIAMNSRDINKSVLEQAAKTGGRGGGFAAGNAIADMTTKLRYSDFMRAMEGRKFFLNTGN